MAIYRYKRSVLVDFIIERPFFPSDWTRADLAFLRIGRVPAGIGYCRPWSHCHTRADPSGGGFASVATEATPVETCHRHVSKSRLSNPQPPSAKTEKGHSFWNVLLFWWKVVDSNHRSHRRQIYSLEHPRRMSNDFRGIPLLFPCSLLHSTNNNSLVRFFSSLFGFVSEDAFAHLLSFHCFQGKNLTHLLSS